MILVLLGAPLSWKKVTGGVSGEWIGYMFCLKVGAVGISPSRAEWVRGCLRAQLATGKSYMRELRQVLGRLSFVAGAVPFWKPFLGPVFRSACGCPLGGFVEIPLSVATVYRFLLAELGDYQLEPCRELPIRLGELFRADASATKEGIVRLGGWSLHEGASTRTARWFAVEVSEAAAPWVFAKQGQPHRVIAALELYATLLCVLLLWPRGVPSGRGSSSVLAFSASTDNQGNAFVLDRFLSTKWPLAPVLCELAAQLRKRGAQMRLVWIPRNANQPADDLSNMKFDKFEMDRRVPVDFEKLDFIILPALLAAGSPGGEGRAPLSASSAAAGSLEARSSSSRSTGLWEEDARPLRVRQPW